MKKIILTGGGTAGHVTPNIALVPKLKEAGFDIKYIGSYNGMEKQLVEKEGLRDILKLEKLLRNINRTLYFLKADL